MAQELMHGWGGLRITCGVTWPPTDAVTGEQKKHKGSLSTGNIMPCPFYNFSGGLLVRCELPSSPNRSVKVKTIVSLSRLWSRWGPVPSGRGVGGPSSAPRSHPSARVLSGALLWSDLLRLPRFLPPRAHEGVSAKT